MGAKLATEKKRKAKTKVKRVSNTKGQLLSLLDRLPGELPVVTCTPPRHPGEEGTHRCGRLDAAGVAFLEWQPGPRSGPEAGLGGDVLFQLGRDDPDFRVDDYQLLSDYLEREQLAGSMRGVHADRAVALIYVLSKRRTRLFEVLKVLRFSMLRRQQDARDRDNTGASRNWSEWNQQQSTTP